MHFSDDLETVGSSVDAWPEEEIEPDVLVKMWSKMRSDAWRNTPRDLRMLLTEAGPPPPEYADVHKKMERFTSLAEQVAERQINRLVHPRQVLAEITPLIDEARAIIVGYPEWPLSLK